MLITVVHVQKWATGQVAGLKLCHKHGHGLKRWSKIKVEEENKECVTYLNKLLVEYLVKYAPTSLSEEN